MRVDKILLALVILGLLTPIINDVATADTTELYKIDGGLRARIGSGETVEVVIILKNPGYTELLSAKARYGPEGVKRILKTYAYTQQPVVEQWINRLGGIVLNRFWILNAILAKVKADDLPAIASLPVVDRIIPNFEVYVDGVVKNYNLTPSTTVWSWGINRTHAPQVWEMGYNGSGIRICTIDTGVDISHPALAGKMLTLDPTNPYYPGGWMAFDSSGNPVPMEPQDTHGHGTHVSGTALGGDGANIVIGVAPGATLMHALALPYGRGSFAQTLAAMEWAADPYYIDPETGEKVYTHLPPHVVSMSWGARNYYGSEFLAPIRNMLLLNIIPVAAIGNGGFGTHDNPGNIYGVFGIGATDEEDNVASFSGGAVIYWPYAPPDWPFNNTYPHTYIKPDFAAPGVRILSSIPGGGYAAWSGTSMATPHVAGIIALLYQATGWDKYPVIDIPEKFYEILRSTALDLGEPGQDPRYGWGIVDAYQAVKKAIEIAKISGVKGYVYDSVDNKPVPYVDVYAYNPAGELVGHARTNKSGYYILPLDPGHYTLVFTRFGYNNYTAEVDVTIYNGTIAGTVTDKLTGDPVDGAVVEVVELGGEAVTGPDGAYELTVPPGRYTLKVYRDGYFSATKQVIVGEGGLVIADFQLYPLSAQAILYVHVYEYFTGAPIEGADVSIRDLGVHNTTDQNGTAVIAGIPPGEYTLVVSKDYYAPRIYEVALSPGEQDIVVNTTYLIAVVTRDTDTFGEDIREALILMGYPSYAIDVIEPLTPRTGYRAVILNYFGTDPGSENLLEFIEAMDTENTSIVFLDSWGAYYYFAGYTMHKYGQALNSEGYPAPEYRSDGYKEGLMLQALDPTNPLFDGISFDEGDRFYIAVSPGDRVDYAVYTSFYPPTSGSIEYLGQIVSGGIVYGYSIAVWEKPGEQDTWIFLSVGGSYHWARYMEEGQDMQYSNNMRRLLFNAVKYAVGIKGSGKPYAHLAYRASPPSIIVDAFTRLDVYLERKPYGWLRGTILAGDTGAPIEGAHVIVEGTIVSTYTSENGSFTLWLPEGTYTIKVEADGYYSIEKTVSISSGETVEIEETLLRAPRAAVMIDFSGQITRFLESRGWYARPYRDWQQLYSDLGFYDVLVLAGEYIGSHVLWPDREMFEKIINKTYQLRIGVVFLNNYFEYRYIKEYPYGINLLYYYYHNPGSIGTMFDKGPVYYVVKKQHPILEGYSVGDRVYLVYGGDYDFAWFSKWDGEVLAYIGAETVGVKGEGIGVKVTSAGTRWVLLAGLAPEVWTHMDYWSEDAKEILYRSIVWAAYKLVNITLSPTHLHVGDTLYIEIPPLPGVVYSVLLDGIVIRKNLLGGSNPTTISIKIPLLERGAHRVQVISEGLYYGEAVFYVDTLIDMNDTVLQEDIALLNITGHPTYSTLLVYIDDNYITSVRTGDVEPLIIKLNIPGYFSEGTHLITLRTLDGEVIASKEIEVTRSKYRTELEDILNSQYNNTIELLLQVVESSTNTSKLLSLYGDNLASLSKNTSMLFLLVNGLNNTIARLLEENKVGLEAYIDERVRELEDNISMEIRGGVSEVENNISILGRNIGTSLASIREEVGSVKEVVVSINNGMAGILSELTSRLNKQAENIDSLNSSVSSLGTLSLLTAILVAIALIIQLAPYIIKKK